MQAAVKNTENNGKPFLKALNGMVQERPPFWLMRQAGRYLPEYQKVRAQAGSFLDLVYNPALAAEVTVQPLRRYGMDAAILFSDILVVPQALGRKVDFISGTGGSLGPRLAPLRPGDQMPVLDVEQFSKATKPVYEAVATVRDKMKNEGFTDTALIGFAGAPWTIACYMVDGQGGRDFIQTRRCAAENPEWFSALIDLIVEATILYLRRQIDAGAEAVQLFDSWAGILNAESFERWAIEPAARIVAGLKKTHPRTPVIGFPRGAGLMMVPYAEKTGIAALSVDHGPPLSWVADHVQPLLPVQGTLDPALLLAGGAALDSGIDTICTTLGRGPFVFNLGHGIHKDTDPVNVARLAARIRAWR